MRGATEGGDSELENQESGSPSRLGSVSQLVSEALLGSAARPGSTTLPNNTSSDRAARKEGCLSADQELGPIGPGDEELDRTHAEFANSLDTEASQLLILRDELYEGSWDDMRRDLEDRRDGKPYIYKLVNRIDEDLRRIERLSSYERRHNVNLGEYLEEE